MSARDEEIELDLIDRKLLRLLQENALATTEEMGEAANLSPTAAKRRANKLHEQGVIRKCSALVDPQRIGFSVFTLVFINLERDRKEIVQRFKKVIRDHPRIVQGFYTTGDADFVLLVASRSLEDYEEFTREFFWQNANVKNFKTMVVMDSIKFGCELPVDE